MADAPTITDWISAVSTTALGVAGVTITAWQWRRGGFDPQLTGRIDERREGIELLVVNAGRAAGFVDQVAVLDGDKVVDAVYEGFKDGAFRPTALPAMASMRVIILAPETKTFPAGVRLQVRAGARRPQTVELADERAGVGIYGLRSVLPPGTPT